MDTALFSGRAWARRKTTRVCEGRRTARAFATAVLAIAGTLAAQAQLGSTPPPQLNPNSAQNPYYGSVTVMSATSGILQLSLEDAVQRGLANNLALTQARIGQQQSHAERLQSFNNLLPTLAAQGSAAAHEFDLIQFGFTKSVLPQFAALLPPGFNPADFNPIVKVNVAQAAATYSETFLDLPAIERYRASKVDEHAAYFDTQSARGLVVLNVGNTYLQALADSAQVDSATSLLRADQLLFQQATARHEAGTAAHLDELRAQVQYQTQQQRVIAAQTTYAKDLILLKREIGVPVEQQIRLSDATPYADLEAMTIEDARTQAYRNRQDYQGLQQQLLAADLRRRAAKYERLPTVSANGDYGVIGVIGGAYHGDFAAQVGVNVPIFREARLRGDAAVAAVRQDTVRKNLENLRQQIDQQLRDSLLDVKTAAELVRVAQSNVELATQELSDANDRFAAGVSDNLPVVQAQASLSGAQAQLINDQLQYNQAKLGLARNLGLVDTQYRRYLHGGK
jgi:outer membrane protein TolC